MDKRGGTAFLVGFLLAAVPLSFWLLGLSYGDNGWKVALSVIVEFISGVVVRALYLRHLRAKQPAKK